MRNLIYGANVSGSVCRDRSQKHIYTHRIGDILKKDILLNYYVQIDMVNMV